LCWLMCLIAACRVSTPQLSSMPARQRTVWAPRLKPNREISYPGW
jgi:hypothetical protein